VNENPQNTPGDLDEIKARIDAMEETIETVCRPVADVFSHERVHAIERSGYEAQLKIEALEKQIQKLRDAVQQAEATVSALTNSRTWQALMKANAFLLRFSGRSVQSGQ
jgi:archaellum component FlaC